MNGMDAQLRRQQERKIRIEKIAQAVMRVRNINRNRLIAEFCLQFSCTRRTMIEYLKILVDAGRLKADKVEVWI